MRDRDPYNRLQQVLPKKLYYYTLDFCLHQRPKKAASMLLLEI